MEKSNEELLLKKYLRYSIGVLSIIVLIPFFMVFDIIDDITCHIRRKKEKKNELAN